MLFCPSVMVEMDMEAGAEDGWPHCCHSQEAEIKVVLSPLSF